MKLHSSSDRHGHGFAVLHLGSNSLRRLQRNDTPQLYSVHQGITFLDVGRASTLKACDENNLLSFESLKEISEIDEMLLSEELVCPRSFSFSFFFPT